MTQSTSCPKCDQPMEHGQLLQTDHDGRHRPLLWAVEAQARALASHMHHGASGFYVTAARCSGCGFVEHFATSEARVAPQDHDA